MLRRAGFTNRAIFLLWSTVLAAGVVAVAGKMFIGNSEPTAALLAQAVAGGAILARLRGLGRFWGSVLNGINELAEKVFTTSV